MYIVLENISASNQYDQYLNKKKIRKTSVYAIVLTWLMEWKPYFKAENEMGTRNVHM
jgi:hypothetical protein